MSILSHPRFHDETAAYEWLEALLWPAGPTCPHCGAVDRIYALHGKAHRIGVKKCGHCRRQFTVKVGTVFESSHVPLHKWLQAMHLLCSSKKGISSHQLHRILEVTYRTAWFMSHRIREAMRDDKAGWMGGPGAVVEADETYYGRRSDEPEPGEEPTGKRPKNHVVALVERGGNVRSFHVERADAATVREVLARNVDPKSSLNTDESAIYTRAGTRFASHETVLHAAKEYARGSVTTNTVEGFFGIFKRGMSGVYQHCGERHLHRYLAEFDFRYNGRKVTDVERADLVLAGVKGKRLTYRRASAG